MDRVRQYLIVIVIAALSTLAAYGAAGNTITIVIDKDGNIETIDYNGKYTNICGTYDKEDTTSVTEKYSIADILDKKFKAGQIIRLAVKDEAITDVEGCPVPQNFYHLEVSVKDRPLRSIPVYKGQVPAAARAIGQKKIFLLGQKVLRRSGAKYTISVARYNSRDEWVTWDKKYKPVIFKMSFETYARYHLGLYVGFLFPFEKTTDYQLLYSQVDDANPTIVEDKPYNPRMLIYGAYYPFGFEPERPIRQNWQGRIHLDLGTEVSGNIFKKIYVGMGYDFKYFSLSLFTWFGNNNQLREGFETGTMINSKNKAVPLESKSAFKVGISIGMPFDIATNWLGKVLGIK